MYQLDDSSIALLHPIDRHAINWNEYVCYWWIYLNDIYNNNNITDPYCFFYLRSDGRSIWFLLRLHGKHKYAFFSFHDVQFVFTSSCMWVGSGLIFMCICLRIVMSNICFYQIWVPCCDVCYDFHIKHDIRFCSSCSCLIYVICVYWSIVVSITYCIVFFVFFCLSASCVPNISSFLELSNIDFPFGFL